MKTRRTDEGFALVVVIGAIFALSVMVLATLAYAGGGVPQSRRSQDSAAALAAAQAGVDDYLDRLNSCDTYWIQACTLPDVNPAKAPGWAPVQLAAVAGEFQYSLDGTPESLGSVIRLRSVGRVGQVTRTVVADLSKDGLLKYVYYSDVEAFDAQTLMEREPGGTYDCDYPTRNFCGSKQYKAYRINPLTAAEAAKCRGYYYTAGSTPARSAGVVQTRQRLKKGRFSQWEDWTDRPLQSCSIVFAATDVVDGALHTNDAMRIDGALFKDRDTFSSWPDASTPAPPPNARWWGGSGPNAAGSTPRYAYPLDLPATNTEIKGETRYGAGGCLYSGATRIELLPNGTMDVTSPGTTVTANSNPGCATGGPNTQNVPIPPNGVVYVQPRTDACSGPVAGTYPETGTGGQQDAFPASYSCTRGDVYVKGTLRGRLTIAAQDEIIITGDTVYAPGGGSVLGLVANGDVEVYHPVTCAVQPPELTCQSYADLFPAHPVTIDAAILSVNRSFRAQHYDKGSRQGTLTVTGGIYQKYRGAVGRANASPPTGYPKDYRYDKRLVLQPPPFFLNPLSAPWVLARFTEQRSAG